MISPKKVVLVTAADRTFFNLLKGFVLSIRQKDTGGKIAIGCFDIGLEEKQLSWLRKHVDRIIKPKWDIDLPEFIPPKPSILALTVRPFLPDYFPEHDICIWVDADVWIQRWYGIEFYIDALNYAEVAVTPHIDRSYVTPKKTWKLRYSQLEQGYGEKVALYCLARPYINSGVMAAKSNSKIWNHWGKALQNGINRSDTVNDQTAFNYAFWTNDISMELLPACCNWQCHLSLPVWDKKNKLLCEPYYPYSPIGLLHLTARAKLQEHEIKTIEGGNIKCDLRYKENP